ncbi:hypothetical protein LOD99_1379 [Oopsacas minuta]|uniref:Uncharacterized protein n=1 Tax=Oopsacas minuta TaxID=111878 RepID=A0AAV7K7V8_9METZ|nr:hypothetical protein LOD99_1379 [Oopsacas minuta]
MYISRFLSLSGHYRTNLPTIIHKKRNSLKTSLTVFPLFTGAVVQSISLETGVRYYSLVRACNKAGLCVTASSDGFLVDISPPIAGIVWDGFSAVDQDFQSYRWVVGAHWYGFHDTESGIQKFEWCVGTQPGECDIRTWMNIYKSEYAFLTLRDTNTSVELPLNTIIYSTVKIYNNVGLSAQSSSDGFLIDDTFPFFTQQPTFNLTLGSIVPGTQIYKTYLRIMWNSNDTISHVISHRVTVHAHVSNISAVAAQNIGNEQQVLFSELELVDGVRYFVRVTACDQSHLCNSSSSDLSVLIDTTPPTVGTFAFDTFTLHNQLNRTLPGTMTWENVNGLGQLQLAWLGFADPHSGISNYSIIVGSGYTQDDLSGGIIVVVDNTTTENEILQATIQLNAELSTHDPNNVIYISIWALNGVGLRSETNQLSFLVTPSADLQDQGILEHQRLDCTIASFYQECTCAALRRLCAARTGNETTQECQPVTSDPYLNISNIVNFHRINEDHNALVTPSLSLLAGSWAFNSVGTEVFTRYQISVGRKAGPGEGLFNIQTENIWFDVGLETFASLSLSALNKILTSNTDYSFYVRAWVDYSTCYIFQSQVIRVDITPPQLANRYRPTDVINSTSTTDIDYQSSTDTVMFNWNRVFFDAESGLDYYEVSLGTTEGGSSLSYGFIRLASTVTFYEFTGLSLTAGRRYYSTVCAYNTVGFQTCLSTDGVLIDTEIPLVGVVTDGVTLHDLRYQNFTTSLGGRWHGFVDLHSFIRYYEWAIGTSPYSDSNDDFKNVMTWERAGLNLTMRREGLSLQHNTMYYVTVRAVDAAGFTSDAVSSNGVLIDTTSPQLMECDQLILEEDFEAFTYRLNDELPVLASNQSILTEPVYDTTPCTCRCSTASHTVVLDFQSHCCCACGVISLNTGIQPGIFHTSYVDQQAYLQQLTHCCCSYTNTQFDDEYHDCICDIEDITADQLGGYVVMGNWELKNNSLSQTLSDSQFIPRSGDRSFLLRDAIITKQFFLDAGVLHNIVFYANYLGVRGNSILTPPKGRVMGAGIDHVFDLNSHIWESSLAYGWRRFAYQFVPRVSTVDFTFEPYDSSYTIVLDDIAIFRCVEVSSSTKGVTLYDTYYTTPNLLQASWVMYDPESAMNFYYWAIGTISGGQQLLPYTLIGNTSQVSAMHLDMQQGTTVYVSAVGINNALLSNFTVSIGVNVELTAPILPGVWDGPGDEDIDYQLLSTTVYMGYDIPYDRESGIKSCEWAVGQSKGSANVLEYMKIPDYTVGHVQASHEMFADDTTLYSTLRCFNGADLEATITTNGFTIVNEPPISDGASVTVIYPQYTPFPKRGNYQATSDHVQFYWEGFQDVTGLESYECRIAGKFTAIIDWVNVGLVHQAYFDDLKLVDRQIYYIYVRAINMVGLKSEPVYASFYVDIKPPSIIGYIRTSWDRRGYLNIDWTDSFSHTSDLKYEFIMGDPPGSDSVKSRLSTGLSTLQLPPSEVNPYSFYSVTVTAITISGLTNTISRLVYPASDS